MPVILNVIETQELLTQFEIVLGKELKEVDAFELFEQLFQLLDQYQIDELANRSVLLFDRFVFTNHLTNIDRGKLNEVAFGILSQLQELLLQHRFYINQQLMYFPFCMVGRNLAVRQYKD